ncbi:MAG: hypothetical protein R3A13_02360 [Bdellovibrionota bacterium]
MDSKDFDIVIVGGGIIASCGSPVCKIWLENRLFEKDQIANAAFQ